MAKIGINQLARMKSRGEPIVVVTAYDAPSARHAHRAGVDCILVGDSAAMTMLGHDSTVPVTVSEMVMLTQAVRRGAPDAFVIADLPFGSYQLSTEQAVATSITFLKEAGADAVKLERAGTSLARIAGIVAEGIAVDGHVGLTPQTATVLGGYTAQGRTAERARDVIADALALEAAGCFAIVLEAIPAPVASRITRTLRVPTIGIGAGSGCDGQVLVWHDLLGWSEGPVPRFVKKYADLSSEIDRALGGYVMDVRRREFPGTEHEYSMPAGEIDRLTRVGG